MLFSKNSNFPIGLDISDLSLKIVQLKKVGKKIKIQALGQSSLTPGTIENGEIKNKDLLLKEISKLILKPQYGSINSNEVVACLPETKTYIKLIEVEKSPNNLSDLIGNEIEKFFPVKQADIYYDWQIIKENENSYHILIGAASQNIVDQYLHLFEKANLATAALEVESTAICRALLTEEKPEFKSKNNTNYGIIDIGAKRASMIIYSNNSIITSISMPLSGEEVTKKISETLEINHEQAEKSKIICGLDKTKAQGIVSDILSDMIGDLNSRVAKTIEFYNDNYSHLGPINKLLICGGGANINNITTAISEAHSIEINEGNVFANLDESMEKFDKNFTQTHNLQLKVNKTAEKLSVKQNTNLEFTTAIGLALRNIFTDKL